MILFCWESMVKSISLASKIEEHIVDIWARIMWSLPLDNNVELEEFAIMVEGEQDAKED